MLTLALLVSCQESRDGILNSDPRFQIESGVMKFQGQAFTGIMRTELPGSWRETPYRDGLVHGVERVWYNDGRLASERYYEKGLRVGIHRGWYPSGKMRFYYEYNHGKMDGEMFTWHENGRLYGYSRYDMGRLVGQKTWRRSGQVYANYVQLENKHLLGLIGSQLCNGTKGIFPE